MNPPAEPDSNKTASPMEKTVQRILSQTLFADGREVVILHNGREYRLRLTQNDKLILTA